MAKPRRQYTLDPEVLRKIERYADQYTGGNQSQALEALVRQGEAAQRLELKRSLAYGAVGVAALLVILVV